MKRVLYGVVALACYIVLYWFSLTVWSLAGFATIGKPAQLMDIGLRAAAIPFVAGTAIAFVFGKRVEIGAVFVAPFAWSTALLLIQDVDWHAMPSGVLGFWVISSVASCAAVGGAILERRIHITSET